MFTSLLKDMIEDTGQRPDEKITQVQAQECPEHRSVYPHGAGVYHPPGVDVFASLEAL